MASVLVEQNSAAGGELSPYLAGRRDLDRWASSWKRVENFVQMPEGVLTRRPGTAFITEAVASDRPALFIPFTFADSDALMIVLNGGSVRFFAPDGTPVLSGGAPYAIANPFSDGELATLRWWQQGNLVFLVSGARAPLVLQRVTATNWTIAGYNFAGGPVEAMNQTRSLRVNCSGATGAITVTADNALFLAGHVGGVWRVEEETFQSAPAWSPNEIVATGAVRRYKGRLYSAQADTPVSCGVNAPEHEFGAWTASGSGVTWTFVSRYYGYFRIDAFVSAFVVTATVLTTIPQSCVSGYSWRWSPAGWDGVRGWPTMIHMHQQSLVFARNDTVWMTKPGDFYDFDIPPTPTDDTGNAFRLTSPKGAAIVIRYFISGVVLIAGTSIGEFIIRGATPSDRLLPTTVRDYLDTEEGCAAHRAQRSDGGAILIGPSRKRLLFLVYERLSESVAVEDLTRYARAAWRRGIAEIAYQREPHRIVWLRHADGSLSSVTFWPKEKFVATARHPMPGALVEHLAALPSLDQTQTDVWFAVRRTIAGVSKLYYEKTVAFFEPLSTDAPTAAGAWHLDCALRYQGAPATTLSGLDHLEGQSVLVNAGGRQVGPLTVAAGRVTLPFAATDAIVGLPATALAETLPRETQTKEGPTFGRKKSVRRILVEALEAWGLRVMTVTPEGPEAADAVWPAGMIGPLGVPALQEGVAIVEAETASDDVQRLRVVADGVFPATVLGLHADLEVHG